MSIEHLRFSPEILRRLGEELVPHPDLGVLELVRNAYDADATLCTISLDDVDQLGGSVRIIDNGDGMDAAAIRSGWLLLGRSSKSSSHRTSSGRRKVGEKGLGRLAALRMGATVDLVTRPTSQPHVEHRLRIKWRDFESVEAVDEVELDLETSPTDRQSGTEIHVEGLERVLNRADIRRLARSLIMLTGPFPATNDFRVELEAPEFAEYEALVRDAYFGECEYHVSAHMSADGRASARLADWNGATVASGKLPLKSDDRYACPRADFELYSFNLSKASFDARHSKESLGVVREWLRVVGGVHLYQRDLRVSPYGDPGHDWLDMNLRRAQSPELRPSTNTSVGRMTVTVDDDTLVPKTDRTGFIENEAFTELRRFGADVLEWMASERLKIRERDRSRDRKRAPRELDAAKAEVSRAVKDLPETVRKDVQSAVTEYQAAVDRQIKTTAEDVLLYRTLGTIGTMSSVFAHETLRPVATIEQTAELLRSRLRRELPGQFDESIAPQLGRIRTAAQTLRAFSELPLRMLARNKRSHQRMDVGRVCAQMLETLGPYLSDLGIDADIEVQGSDLRVLGAVTSLEAVMANLIANAAYFIDQVPESGERKILVRVSAKVHDIEIRVSDSGPGIQGIRLDEIWLPGRTTRRDGSGLGLTIARDSVRDLGGGIEAVRRGALGGAEFLISLPYAPDDLAPPLPFEEG